MGDYTDRIVYDCFNKPFTFYFGIKALNISSMPIGDRYFPKKTLVYPDMHPAVIYVSFENYVCNFIKHSDSPEVLVLNSDGNKPQHSMKKDKT